MLDVAHVAGYEVVDADDMPAVGHETVAQVRADEEFEKTAFIYTNHTVVRAGLEMFYASTLHTIE